MTPAESYRLCLENFRAGRLSQAEVLARDLLAKIPNDARLWHLFGVIIARLGRIDDALDLFARAHALAPDLAPILHDQAIAFSRVARPAEALDSLDRAVGLAPGFSEAWNTRGRVLIDLGRYQDALTSLDTALESRPEYADALANRGDALQLLNRNDEALSNYERALELKPAHARAACGRGVVLNAVGRHHEALRCHDRAILLSPDFAEAHNGRGVALAWLGEHVAAIASFARALALRPDYVDALLNNSHALRAIGREQEALESYDRVLRLDPTSIDALHTRGLILADLDRHEEAIKGYDLALAAKPAFPEALIAKGSILARLERYDEALACYDQALTLAPDSADARSSHANTLKILQGSLLSAEAHFFRGDTLRFLGRHAEAVAAYDEAIALRPDDANVWNHRGIALQELDEHIEALRSYDKALALRPRSAGALANRGAALRNLGRIEEAIASAKQALVHDPGNAGAHASLGHSFRILGRIPEALTHFEAAMEFAPDDGPARFNRAACLLLDGNFELGWKEYEWRWTLTGMSGYRRRFEQPLWLGQEKLDGQTILLYGEQGHGDTIQFCRYIPLIAAQGATVLLGVSPLLSGLLANIEGVSRVFDRADAKPIFDTHCPLLSLPLAFGTRLDTVPRNVPYIRPPANRMAEWRTRLGEKRGLRIGIAWSGNLDHKDDRHRSIPLDLLDSLVSLGPQFYCLQRELRSRDVPAFAMHRGIEFFGADLRDFCDTAALVAHMDLVISVDTAVLHLAGAMGRPVWGLLPFAPDWRWMLNREDSPWYPTLRLFRQPAAGDWQSVLRRIGDELKIFRDSEGHGAPAIAVGTPTPDS